LERNKQNVVALYALGFNQCRPSDTIARYASAAYIQNNPSAAESKQAFKTGSRS